MVTPVQGHMLTDRRTDGRHAPYHNTTDFRRAYKNTKPTRTVAYEIISYGRVRDSFVWQSYCWYLVSVGDLLTLPFDINNVAISYRWLTKSSVWHRYILLWNWWLTNSFRWHIISISCCYVIPIWDKNSGCWGQVNKLSVFYSNSVHAIRKS